LLAKTKRPDAIAPRAANCFPSSLRWELAVTAGKLEMKKLTISSAGAGQSKMENELALTDVGLT
jgi:hypothetical protein